MAILELIGVATLLKALFVGGTAPAALTRFFMGASVSMSRRRRPLIA